MRAVIRRRWRIGLLVGLTLSLSLTLFNPIRTVAGLVTDTGIQVTSLGLSVDASRIAFIGPLPSLDVFVYDTISGSSTSFPAPAPITDPFHGVDIYGDKVIFSLKLPDSTDSDVYYCVLPSVEPLAPCSAWQLIVRGAFIVSGLAFKGDLVVWDIPEGFSFFRFSTGITKTVRVPEQPLFPATNGAVIAFATLPAGVPGPLMYYDITATTPGVVNTGLLTTGLARALVPGAAEPSTVSLSQNIVAFEECVAPPQDCVIPAPGSTRIRFYDILRNESSPAGTGPIGIFPAIWGDRIAFEVGEDFLGFDCSGTSGIQPTDFCLRYWNINTPSFAAPLLAPSASPAVRSFGQTGVGIYDKVIAFRGPNDHLQYVTVPMRGDVNLDGLVNVLDLVNVGGCMFQTIKGTTC